ncbi:MAG: FABP family protein [Actinomycetota bacterium]|nr:FABP family protein [Actinomycetota bacterium]MDA8208083.1 FABP family protein [Actinomycetota bacterium]
MDSSGAKSFIEGEYRGHGHGSYPTISDFAYLETLTFTLSPKGFIIYSQATANPETGAPLHQERGYLRIGESMEAEFVIAQPTGVAEIGTGPVREEGGALVVDLHSTGLIVSPTAKPVDAIRRRYRFTERGLDYEMWMAIPGVELTVHLSGSLTRQGA